MNEQNEQRFEISVTHGSDATDYDDLAKTEQLNGSCEYCVCEVLFSALTFLSAATEVEVSIRKLNDRVRLIRAEQDYQRVSFFFVRCTNCTFTQ